MKKLILSLLFAACCVIQAAPNYILGLNPNDTVRPEFFGQNGNADAMIDGLSSNATHVLTLPGITLTGFNGLRNTSGAPLFMPNSYATVNALSVNTATFYGNNGNNGPMADFNANATGDFASNKISFSASGVLSQLGAATTSTNLTPKSYVDAADGTNASNITIVSNAVNGKLAISGTNSLSGTNFADQSVIRNLLMGTNIYASTNNNQITINASAFAAGANITITHTGNVFTISGVAGGSGVTSNGFQTNLTAIGADNHDAVTISSTSSNNALALTGVNNRIIALPPSDTNADGNSIIFRASDSGVNGANGGAIVFYSGHSTVGNSGSIVFGDTNISEMVISPSDQTVSINSQLYVGEVDVGSSSQTIFFDDGSGTSASGNINWDGSGHVDAASISIGGSAVEFFADGSGGAANGSIVFQADGSFSTSLGGFTTDLNGKMFFDGGGNPGQSDGDGGLNNDNGLATWYIRGETGEGQFSQVDAQTVYIDAGDSVLHGNTGYLANNLIAWDSDDNTWANWHITGGTNTPLVLDSSLTFIKFSGSSSAPATNTAPITWVGVTVGTDTNGRVPVFH